MAVGVVRRPLTGFEEFCGGTFWDGRLTWTSPNITWPQFTPCFLETVLPWIPCFWLWLTLPISLVWLISQQGTPLSISKLTITKTGVGLILVLISVMEILLAWTHGIYRDNDQDDESVLLMWFITPTIKALSFLLSVILIRVECKLGFITSGFQFCFYLLAVLANIIPFYSNIFYLHGEGVGSNISVAAISLFYIEFVFLLIQFTLHCFAEKLPKEEYGVTIKGPCPEILSSFISRATYSWLTNLIIAGYRKALDESDVWDPTPRDRCSTVVPEFNEAWEEEVSRVKRITEKRDKAFTETRKSYYDENVALPSSPEKVPLIADHGREHRKNYGCYLADEPAHTSNLIQDDGGDGDMPVVIRDGYKKEEPSLLKVMAKLYGLTVFKAFCFKLVNDMLQFANPLILKLLIKYTDDKSIETWKGYVYMAALFVALLTGSCCVHQSLFQYVNLGIRLKAAIIAAVYKKALTMSNEARKTSTVGEIVNLMSVDAQRIQDVVVYLWMIFTGPIQIPLALYLLYIQIGVAMMAGLVVMVILVLLNAFTAIKMRTYQREQMKHKDDRIKLISEVLNGIKVLKFYAWETSFDQKIEDIRRKELSVLRKLAFLGAVNTSFWTVAPFIITLTTFTTYILITPSNSLDASTAFVSLTLLNILRVPMNAIPILVSFLIQAGVAVSRVHKFLSCGELDFESIEHDSNSKDPITINDATFSWDQTENPCLNNINLTIPDGSLVAVVGPVGSGKSSLISAVLGEMVKLTGKVNVRGRVAYVPQQAFIQNATVRDNILFGKDFHEKTYREIVDACALKPDFSILAAGDQTEIGEKGINLSGGQKQRVSVARAVYNDADIYLLDDPLSAVDSHVGKSMFEQVISKTGLLKHKTRILVTHGIHLLPMVDQIVVMNDGEISEVGSYEVLMSRNGAFAQFMHTYLTKEAEGDFEKAEEEEVPEVHAMKLWMMERLDYVLSNSSDHTEGARHQLSKSMQRSNQSNRVRKLLSAAQKLADLSKSIKKQEEELVKDRLIEEEKSETGQVKMAVYLSYFRAVGVISSIGILLTHMGYNVFGILANVWLSSWTESPTLKNTSLSTTATFQDTNHMYLAVYGAFGICQALFVSSYTILFALGQVHASKQLHGHMLKNILRSPMSFFDTTPNGRIVNRFSRDIETVDNNLPLLMQKFLNSFFIIVSNMIIITYTTPVFLVVIIPLFILYYLIQRFYIATSRQLKRVESTTRSPIYNHFSETVTGASSIRAYRAQGRFLKESENLVDRNLVFYFCGTHSARWLGIRIELLGNCLVMAAILFTIIGRDTLSGGLVGLAVSYALQVTTVLTYTIRQMSELETNIVSVERLKEYTETPNEADRDNPEKKPPSNWPQDGRIQFHGYMTRYRPGLDLVLRGITCQINPKEKVGIVGRTGAGKSSLAVALFRLIEASAGNIIIDDIIISDLGLHDLRQKLSILPQDPVLFSGTLRMNLDPFDRYTDEQIWVALEHAHLKHFVNGLSSGLLHECGEGGQNLSVGQRQLVCLARTLLRKTKILILDEATAAVDMETDDLIQNTIKTEFSECTVISIAHRLNTIMDYDRIMVLDNGCIVEYDTPATLMKNKNGVFYGMAKDAGLTS